MAAHSRFYCNAFYELCENASGAIIDLFSHKTQCYLIVYCNKLKKEKSEKKFVAFITSFLNVFLYVLGLIQICYIYMCVFV